MQKWEYQTVPVGPKLTYMSAREELNKHGNEGWEFVAVLATETSPVWIFKRPKT